jgi:hypothetical protein
MFFLKVSFVYPGYLYGQLGEKVLIIKKSDGAK